MEENEAEGFDAYARALLNWYRSGMKWVYVTDENETPMGYLLLETLKKVRDETLCKNRRSLESRK
ncbi:hypothetical protein KEJ24_01950 [Candidatus Bathyarchaeota archaeon]|nr:hypothetical protein [Candidatus Bathyarchaeota archaeon]